MPTDELSFVENEGSVVAIGYQSLIKDRLALWRLNTRSSYWTQSSHCLCEDESDEGWSEGKPAVVSFKDHIFCASITQCTVSCALHIVMERAGLKDGYSKDMFSQIKCQPWQPLVIVLSGSFCELEGRICWDATSDPCCMKGS